MVIYSEKFEDSMNISPALYEEFKNDMKNTSHFDENELDNLVYYAYDIYQAKGNPFRKKYTKAEYLKKFVRLLNYLAPEQLLELKAFEILKLFQAPNITEEYYNL